MAQDLHSGGVRIFTGTSIGSLESQINTYLEGDGTISAPKKKILDSHFIYNADTTSYVAMIVYEPL